MTKQKAVFRCSSCGYETYKWIGQCTECGAWNSFEEQSSSVVAEGGLERLAFQTTQAVKGQTKQTHSLETIVTSSNAMKDNGRHSTGIVELDRVFGGGLVPGSVTLLSGEPGIGKSTLTLSLCIAVASAGKKLLYVSGEESLHQIAMRAKRMQTNLPELQLLAESMIENIIATIIDTQSEIVVLDSIQVLYAASLSSMAGSIGQVRFVTELLVELAKSRGITIILIGHVTKDGNIAGPKVLEHLVDVVLLLEGSKTHELRMLKAEKNRFGATDEVGVFHMTEKGMEEVANPSEMFLSGRREDAFGSCISSVVEGTRAFMLEVQALNSYTKFGYPKRTSVGYDTNRLQLILAVIGMYTKTSMDSYDVYVNLIGGLRTRDTALDLAVLLAVLSVRLKKPLPVQMLAVGEVGLTGEIRSVALMDKRVKEAEKLGMKTIIVPASAKLSSQKKGTIEIIKVATVEEAVKKLFG